MTGSAWVEEGGFLEGPIGITNTHSVGVVRDTIIQWQVAHTPHLPGLVLPAGDRNSRRLAERYQCGFHVKPEHVWSCAG
jgi:D-aminopeptidase